LQILIWEFDSHEINIQFGLYEKEVR